LIGIGEVIMLQNSEVILNNEDVLKMLDSLLREPTTFWDGFYTNREKKVPFFKDLPDENLVQYFEKGLLKPGKVLELGCGPGRNAFYFAKQGCEVDAVDLSKEALKWGEERALEKKLNINFIFKNIFQLDFEEYSYDVVYDSGCFHHIAPHRRISYLDLLHRTLKDNGLFALTCFVAGGCLGGSELTDWEVYRRRSLEGGLGYTEEMLQTVFRDFELIEMRPMRVLENDTSLFGMPDLLTALFRKTSSLK
jgi:cyclopropane fatty-acyl-phospholipid synthase-like methyltransferase